jgi:HPt (histidine-containing phosphotransfer) domain-containing protein
MDEAPPIESEKLDELREILSGEDDGAFERFLRVYLSSSERGLRDLHAAVAGSDAAVVERFAHLLKGSSGNVGADRLADACRLMETSARHGRKGDWNFSAVEAEFARVRAALEPLARSSPTGEIRS